jgi:ribosomal-protein-alanine N-acetyltransferase
MERQIDVQPMRLIHLDEVLSIESASFSTPWRRDMFAREISQPSSVAVVWRAGHEVVGYLCFWKVVDEAHVMTLAVHPARRGQGIGRLIMEYLEGAALNYGLRRIILEVGRRNSAARALYRRHGFKVIGFRKRYYADIGDDAFVMEKWLGRAGGQDGEHKLAD